MKFTEEQDRQCVKKLIELGMFTNIIPDKLGIQNGLIIAPCSDGHQFEDTYSHITGICKGAYQVNCIHPVALNGGALLMSGAGALLMSSDVLPEKRRQHGKVMLENVLEACEIKKVNHVHLYTHTNCAVAGSIGLGVLDQGYCLMAAKQRLKQENPNLHVSCFFHTYDKKDGDSLPKRRTYFMPKELWNVETEVGRSALRSFQEMYRGQ